MTIKFSFNLTKKKQQTLNLLQTFRKLAIPRKGYDTYNEGFLLGEGCLGVNVFNVGLG